MAFKFFGKRRKANGWTSLPVKITEPVEGLMKAGLMLVSFEEPGEVENTRRQRAAACAFGATDWLCQANKLQLNDLDWMAASTGIMMQYISWGDPSFVDRVGAERVGELMGEIASGKPELAQCMRVGAEAMRCIMIEQDRDAPLQITDCIKASL